MAGHLKQPQITRASTWPQLHSMTLSMQAWPWLSGAGLHLQAMCLKWPREHVEQGFRNIWYVSLEQVQKWLALGDASTRVPHLFFLSFCFVSYHVNIWHYLLTTVQGQKCIPTHLWHLTYTLKVSKVLNTVLDSAVYCIKIYHIVCL